MKRALIIIGLVGSISAFAQKLENLKAIGQGDKIIISYDINGAFEGDKVNVQLYGSHNDYSIPIQRISGDYGNGIAPGKGKKIEWETKAELGNYAGEISFEIRAEVIAVFALTKSLTKAKRGKTLNLKWRGGDKNENVKIELLKAGKVQGTLGTVANTGSYLWKLPAKQTLGKDYALRMANAKEIINSSAFSIQPKYPMWMKIGVPVIIGGVVAIMTTGGDPKSGTLISPPDILN